MKEQSTCRLYILGLVLLPVFCFSQRPDDVNAISCSGYVYEKASQKPLEGALINITNTETNKRITNVLTTSNGSYFFTMPSVSDIKLTVTKDGYKKSEQRFTKADLKNNERRLPAIYLDTTIKIDFTPAAPFRQSTDDYVKSKLGSINMLPIPAAYELLVYLNPDLRERDSLMSNDKIILPKMPRLSNKVKRDNRERFQEYKKKDGATQNRLRDSIDKLVRILSDDILRYPVKYENQSPETIKQMREYMRMDLQDFSQIISKTSRLKSEELMEVLSKLSTLQQNIIVQRALPASAFDRMKLLWEDLSYLLGTSRYRLFSRRVNGDLNKTALTFISAGYLNAATITANEKATTDIPPGFGIDKQPTSPAFEQDEVGVFGLVVWSESITSPTNPDMAQPSSRYIIRYYKPAFEEDKSTYKICSGNANVAIANLTRAKYGVEVFDTKENRFVETFPSTFTTDEAFTDRRYDALLVPDFKEIKYIPIRLK